MAKRKSRRSGAFSGTRRIRDFLPSLPQLTSEILAVLGATIFVSLLISKVPALQKLVRDNTVPGPLNP